VKTKDRWKGFLAGALGGFAGSFAMSQFHSLLQPAKGSSQVTTKEDSTVRAASAIWRGVSHRALTAEQKKIAAPAVHYGFGTTMSALYGTFVESAPSLAHGRGIPFGIALWLAAHVITVPLLGLSEPVTESAPDAELTEFGGHLVYGAVAEGLRRLLRSRVFP